MITQSIKWRLQAWHALMLVVVLSGFGFTAYQLDRVSRYQRIDRELQQRTDAIMRALREQQGPPDGARGDDRELPPEDVRGEFPERRRFEGERPPWRDGPMDGETGPPRGPRLGMRGSSLFATNNGTVFYYALFHREGRMLSKSDSAPADLQMPTRGGSNNVIRVRGTLREVISFTPPGEAIIAGLDVSAERAELRRLGWLLFTAGGGVLMLGLAGGWWMATRAIRPIQDISATAAKISAGDLSQRIETAETESELGQLAGVLNSTFARLDAAFAQQQQFTSDAAHELRTPVSVILTQIQSTLNKERSGPEYRETLEACQRAAQRMRRLIESLLELARFDAGQQPLKQMPFDLAAVARDCADLVQPLAQERGVMIFCELPEANCQGDSERIGQVVTNLLTNAVNYNRSGGEVWVRTRLINDSVELSVVDNGPGIPPEHLAKIFDRFYRADSARTSAQGRTGLGLAICKAIVVAHGGSIAVANRSGSGAEFTVRLPAT